jgi:ribosomal-protein-alanine N-acetyltransferase
MTGLTILPMTAETAIAVAELERLCFSAPWSLESLQEEVTNPRARYAVALDGGRVIGYAGLHEIIDEGYITNIAVSPKARRKGVGRALVLDMIKTARENGLAFLTLEVRESNAAAISLYTSSGFEPVGIRPGYYNRPAEDALMMTLFLKPSERVST